MGKAKLLLMGCVAGLLVSSCGMMNDGFSGSSIQKRKYTKGFYISKNKKWSSAKEKRAELLTAEEKEVVENEVVLNEQELVVNTPEQTATQPQQQPAPKQTEKNDGEQTQHKKEAPKKVAGTEKKSTQAPARPARKERVPERYLPVKADQKNQTNKEHKQGMGAGDELLVLCIILAILIPPLAVGIWTNIDWMKVLICLLLCILFFLPGMIYALLVVLDVI